MAENQNDHKREEELEQENLEDEDNEEQEDDGSDDPYESLSEEEAKDRLRKAEKAIEMSKKAEKKKQKKSRNINNQEDDKFERLELKVSGYPDEVIDSIIELGGKEALDDPVKRKVIDEYTKQAKAEQAAEVESSSKSGVSKKYSKEELRQMSSEELEKAYNEMGL